MTIGDPYSIGSDALCCGRFHIVRVTKHRYNGAAGETAGTGDGRQRQVCREMGVQIIERVAVERSHPHVRLGAVPRRHQGSNAMRQTAFSISGVSA